MLDLWQPQSFEKRLPKGKKLRPIALETQGAMKGEQDWVDQVEPIEDEQPSEEYMNVRAEWLQRYKFGNKVATVPCLTGFTLMMDHWGQRTVEQWEEDLRLNFVGRTKVGRQMEAREAMQLLQQTAELQPMKLKTGKSADILAQGREDLLCCAGGKGRPAAGRLRYMAEEWKKKGDPEMAQWLDQGIPWRRTEVIMQPAVFHNSISCYKNQEFFDNEMQALLDIGALRPYNTEMVKKWGPPVIVSPLNVAQGTKLRVCYDNRYGNYTDGPGDVQFDDLGQFIKMLQRGMNLAKTDLRSGYHHIPLREEDAPYVCLHWKGQIYHWTCLPFGLRSAPAWFTRATRAVDKELRRVCDMLLAIYIDDFCMGLPVELQKAQGEYHKALMIIVQFGWVLALDKCIEPGLQAEMLGFEVDTKEMMVQLTERRKEKIMTAMKEISPGTKVVAKRVAILAGLLTSAERGMWYAARLAYPFYDIIRKVESGNQWYEWVHWSQQAMEAASLLQAHWNELNKKGMMMNKPEVTLIGDSTQGFGAAVVVKQPRTVYDRNESHPESTVAWQWQQEQTTIALKEAKTIVQGAKQLEMQLKGKKVQVLTDNLVAMWYLRKGGGRVREMAQTAWEFTKWLIENQVKLTAVRWLPTEANGYVDKYTREEAERELMITDRVWQWLQRIWRTQGRPEPTMDAMATRASRRCERFISRTFDVQAEAIDFFTAQLDSEEILWVNPPWDLVETVLGHMRAQEWRGYVLMPAQGHIGEWMRRNTWSIRLPSRLRPFFMAGVEKQLVPGADTMVAAWPPGF